MQPPKGSGLRNRYVSKIDLEHRNHFTIVMSDSTKSEDLPGRARCPWTKKEALPQTFPDPDQHGAAVVDLPQPTLAGRSGGTGPARVMELRERVLEPEHHHALTSMTNLAPVYPDGGQLADVEDLVLEALAIRRSCTGDGVVWEGGSENVGDILMCSLRSFLAVCSSTLSQRHWCKHSSSFYVWWLEDPA